jgi:hypothetical protein
MKSFEESFEELIPFFQNWLNARLDSFFNHTDFKRLEFNPSILEPEFPISKIIKSYDLDVENIILILTSLIPHILPGLFDQIIKEYMPEGGEFPEIGGTRTKSHRGLLPTGETALFLIGGTSPKNRLLYLKYFDQRNILFKNKILSLETVNKYDPILSGRLVIDHEYTEVITTGKVRIPSLSINFPAEHLQSRMTWEDLVLPEQVWHQINDLQIWIRHKDTLQQNWDLGRKFKPGYRALFYGPPGTGKTITATLLGKYTQKEVFRIDLSMVVSKYIGETEKNLATLFDKAENKDWILFFDEADAIFGKRTGVRDAHDKYANQEVSYLLQRIEAYNGLVILASNFRNNIDQAFIRRFNAIIYFPSPKPEERLSLWKKSLPEQISLDKDLDLREIADRYDLTGSHIMNIVHYLSLMSLDNRRFILNKELIIRGIKRELEKEGK